MTRPHRALLCLVLSLPECIACAEDFKLSDGTVFRQVRVLEVRPDALILSHEKGVAMADLDKLPKAIRSRYHYDPAKAAAYREREAATRQAVAEENRRLVVTREERQMELSRMQFEGIEGTGTPGEAVAEMSFSYRASAAERAHAAAISRIAGEIGETEQMRNSALRQPLTFWNSDFWNNPVMKFLGMVLGGSNASGEDSRSPSEPRGWR
jgi:hypothetical protein